MVDLNESGLAQDWQAIGRMNATGALMGMTFLTIALFDGRLNWDVFMPGWARSQDLLAQTAAGTVFVMDHASLDKGHEMLEAISANPFQLTVPTLTGWNTNGLQLKPLEGNTDVVWMNSFLSIHNMSFYNDLAIPLLDLRHQK